MLYRYYTVPLMGTIYLEYWKGNKNDWHSEWFGGEFYGYWWKFRLIFTPKNYHDDSHKGNGATKGNLYSIKGNRKNERTRPRNSGTNHSSVSCCG